MIKSTDLPRPEGSSPAPCSALEERLTFLRGGSTERLLSLLGETLSTDASMTVDYFALAMDPRFRTSQTTELFDMLTTVLRERLPNDEMRDGERKTSANATTNL